VKLAVPLCAIVSAGCVLILTACGASAGPASTGPAAPTVATAVGGSGIVVSGAWLRLPVMAEGPGAGYLLIRNSGPEDKLIAVVSDVAVQVELHQSMASGGMMQMMPVEFIPVPAGGQTELKPGGYHLMFLNLKRTIKVDDKLTLLLTFEKAGLLFVDAHASE
jgi:periplasmic copper chaperone A